MLWERSGSSQTITLGMFHPGRWLLICQVHQGPSEDLLGLNTSRLGMDQNIIIPRSTETQVSSLFHEATFSKHTPISI
jgi:hypothetical protein